MRERRATEIIRVEKARDFGSENLDFRTETFDLGEPEIYGAKEPLKSAINKGDEKLVAAGSENLDFRTETFDLGEPEIYGAKEPLKSAINKGDEKLVAALMNGGSDYIVAIVSFGIIEKKDKSQYIDIAHTLFKASQYLDPKINRFKLFSIILGQCTNFVGEFNEGDLKSLFDLAKSYGYDLHSRENEACIFAFFEKIEFFIPVFKEIGISLCVEDISYLLKMEKFSFLKILKDAGFDLSVGGDIYDAALTDGGKDFLSSENFFSSQEEVEKFSTLHKARIMLNGFYGSSDFDASVTGVRFKFISRDILETGDLEKKELLSDIFKSINEDSAIENGDNQYEIAKVPYITHAAYFIVDYRNGIPQSISFCNGGFPYWNFGEGPCGYGEVTFKIDNKKVEKIGSIKKFISEVFKRLYTADEIYPFLNDIAKIVVCDASGRPVVAHFNVATVLQKHGNCGFKSLNILYRAMLHRMYPELDFKRDESGKISGPGHEMYKRYKKAVVAKNVNRLLSLENPENTFAKIREEASKRLQEIFNRAIEKADLDVIKMILPMFMREGWSPERIGLQRLKLKEENKDKDKKLLKDIFWQIIDNNPWPLTDLQKDVLDSIWDICCKAEANISPHENSDVNAILRWAALEKKSPELVNLMARNDADVNCENGDGCSLTAQAVRIKDIPLGVVQELINFEADIDVNYKHKIRGRGTPIFRVAMFNDREDICNLLSSSRGFKMPNLGPARDERFYSLPEEKGIFKMLKDLDKTSPGPEIKSPIGLATRTRWKS